MKKHQLLMAGVATTSLFLAVAAFGQASTGSTAPSHNGRGDSNDVLGSGPSNDPSGLEQSTTPRGNYPDTTTSPGEALTSAPDARAHGTNTSASRGMASATPHRRHHRRHAARGADTSTPDTGTGPTGEATPGSGTAATTPGMIGGTPREPNSGASPQ